MARKRALTVGVAWYTEEDWAQLKTIFDDADSLPARYADWLALAELSLEALKYQGLKACKVYITPDDFTAWCAHRGLRKNALARMQYANAMIATANALPKKPLH